MRGKALPNFTSYLRRKPAMHPSGGFAAITGLRCPHHAAHAEACLHSATAAPAPSRFLRRRRRSTPQPLAGEPFKRQTPKSLPCKGRWMRRKAQTEGCGALPCQYPSGPAQTFPAGVNACPTIQGIRAHNRGQQATAAPDHRNACVGPMLLRGAVRRSNRRSIAAPCHLSPKDAPPAKKEKVPGWQIPGSLLRRLVSYAQARAARQGRGVPFSGSAGAGAPISPKSRAAFCCGWGGAACAVPWPRSGGCARG